jgi:hypothetical protein
MNEQVLALSSRRPKAGQAPRAPTASLPRKRVVCEPAQGESPGAE